jgi:frataxin-like iron-binding protein CyaY
MNGYNATKARRIAANLRKEVKGFELVPTAGQDNYVIAQTRLDGLNVSSLNGKLIVNTKVHSKIRLNIENPFDHAKEIKGLVQKRIDIQVGLSANIEFTKDGKIKLTNKNIVFSPRFSFSGVLSPLESLANKMNNKISDKIKSAVDKQIAKIEFKKIVDEKLTSVTKTINKKTSEDNIWLIPNISKIHFKTTKEFALNRNKVGVNLGLTFKPEVIYSEDKPDAIDRIAYDVTLTNDHSKNQIALNSTALIDVSDVSSLLSSKVQEAMNKWLKTNESEKSIKKKWFDIDKVQLLTSQGKVLIVLYTKKPVYGTIILTTSPVIENNGHSLILTNASLYVGTRTAVTDETSWLLQLPFMSILEDKLSINLKSHFDKGLAKIKTEGVPISKTEKIAFKDESFALKRFDASNGNLLIEISLNSNIAIEPRDIENTLSVNSINHEDNH